MASYLGAESHEGKGHYEKREPRDHQHGYGPDPPELPGLSDLVSPVGSLDNCLGRRRTRPEGEQDREKEGAGGPAPQGTVDVVSQEANCVFRQEAPHPLGQGPEDRGWVVHGEARHRDHEHEEGEQREQGEVGKLSREPQAVVLQRLAPYPFERINAQDALQIREELNQG